jgi:hypothetical protein
MKNHVSRESFIAKANYHFDVPRNTVNQQNDTGRKAHQRLAPFLDKNGHECTSLFHACFLCDVLCAISDKTFNRQGQDALTRRV